MWTRALSCDGMHEQDKLINKVRSLPVLSWRDFPAMGSLPCGERRQCGPLLDIRRHAERASLAST